MQSLRFFCFFCWTPSILKLNVFGWSLKYTYFVNKCDWFNFILFVLCYIKSYVLWEGVTWKAVKYEKKTIFNENIEKQWQYIVEQMKQNPNNIRLWWEKIYYMKSKWSTYEIELVNSIWGESTKTELLYAKQITLWCEK